MGGIGSKAKLPISKYTLNPDISAPNNVVVTVIGPDFKPPDTSSSECNHASSAAR